MRKDLIKEEDLSFLINKLISQDNLDEKSSSIIFMYSAVIGNIEKIKYFLERNIDVNIVDDKGKTALIHSVINNNIEIVKLLLKNGADVNIKDKRGLTAIKYAIKNKNVEIANVLTTHGAILTKTKLKSNLDIINATKENNYELVKLLIQDGIDINVQDTYKWTALHYAVKNDNLEMVKLLLENGIDPNILTNLKETALMIGVDMKVNIEIIKLLIDYKTGINIKSYYGRTALMSGLSSPSGSFSKFINKEVLELLLENGANPNLQDDKGVTALMIAVSEDNYDKVKILLDYNAYLNTQDQYGDTALHYAVNKSNLKIAKLLLEYTKTNAPIIGNNPYGANPNIKNNNNETPLKICVRRYDIDMIELLLSHGANPNIIQKFSLLYFSHDYRITKLLLEYRSDPNLGDYKFLMEDVIKNAIANENSFRSLELLIGYGINIDYKMTIIKELKKNSKISQREKDILELLKNAKKIRQEYLMRDDLYKVEASLNEEDYSKKLEL